MDATGASCRLLDWDSEFFGLRIGRILPARLDAAVAREALSWCTSHAIRCLYFLADAGDGDSIRIAEENAFRLVDVRVTLERDLAAEADPTPPSQPGTTLVREARAADRAALGALAASNHRGTRFHRDPTFTTAQADALYARWIERSCDGWADAVFVADRGGVPAGYTTCHRGPAPGVGSIGLAGVDAQVRGQGVGSMLMGAALRWFRGQGVRRVTVATQGGNGAAQRLYQRAGFLVRSTELWYHRSFP